jgi:hypothetical protein
MNLVFCLILSSLIQSPYSNAQSLDPYEVTRALQTIDSILKGIENSRYPLTGADWSASMIASGTSVIWPSDAQKLQAAKRIVGPFFPQKAQAVLDRFYGPTATLEPNVGSLLVDFRSGWVDLMGSMGETSDVFGPKFRAFLNSWQRKYPSEFFGYNRYLEDFDKQFVVFLSDPKLISSAHYDQIISGVLNWNPKWVRSVLASSKGARLHPKAGNWINEMIEVPYPRTTVGPNELISTDLLRHFRKDPRFERWIHLLAQSEVRHYLNRLDNYWNNRSSFNYFARFNNDEGLTYLNLLGSFLNKNSFEWMAKPILEAALEEPSKSAPVIKLLNNFLNSEKSKSAWYLRAVLDLHRAISEADCCGVDGTGETAKLRKFVKKIADSAVCQVTFGRGN